MRLDEKWLVQKDIIYQVMFGMKKANGRKALLLVAKRF